MIITTSALQNLQSHWAISAISKEDHARASELINQRLVNQAVGGQIAFAFHEEGNKDDNLLERVALAHEMAAIEGLDALSRPDGGDSALRSQSMAASHRAYELRRLTPVPENTEERIFHVLQLAALAYCGDRWSDLRRWFTENKEAVAIPSVTNTPWDQQLLYRLFECWVRLLRKDGWKDLERIREIIAQLRIDQQTFEKELLNNDSTIENRAIAFRLIALYHWAKGTEILAEFMLQGLPKTIFSLLDKHFESGIKAATASGDARHEMILRWLHVTGRMMVTNSLWWSTRAVNTHMTAFVRAMAKREHHGMFELLPPQRAALLEQGLLDQAKTAIVIDMPTSGGKTLLAQFRMLQALNQFDADKGWVAYVAPTKALTAQITRRLRRDFGPVGLRVEQLTGAIDVDAFEADLLTEQRGAFDILVATPEKISLVIRNKLVSRPLVLVVIDEAHNIEAPARGMRIELLLATIKGDCPLANFLLMMPYVEKSETLAHWLAQDINAGKAISFGTTAWKPNERIVGLYRAVKDNSQRAGWRLEYETLTVTEKAMKLHGTHQVGDCKPINIPRSKVLNKEGQQKGLGLQTSAIASVMSERGTSIAVANRISTVWQMARLAADSVPKLETIPDDVRLVQDFLKTEVSPNFELTNMLNSGVGVHHGGLSDEIRTLMEWLAESGHLRVLCATSTIAQGINFPVSSIFLASRSVPQRGYSVEISPREFWNLAGRAGRIGHDSVGVVGIAEGKDRDKVINLIRRSTGALASRLVTLLDDLAAQGELNNLDGVLWQDQWEDFRCYVAHLWAEKKNLDAVLAGSEQLLRQTYGYTTLRNDPDRRAKADALLNATKNYARKLALQPSGTAELADLTGFSPEGVGKAIRGINRLENRLKPDDWTPRSLFGDGGRLADLFGVMLKIPQLKKQLTKIGKGDTYDQTHLSRITRDWVNGVGLEEIAKTYFTDDRESAETEAFTQACRAIYRGIVNNGTWGMSALSRVSGIDFEKMTPAERRRINVLPAMIYHGVRTEDAVLMRMNFAPRSASENLGSLYRDAFNNNEERYSVEKARTFLKNMSNDDWTRATPDQAALSGPGYKKVWEVLSGEGP